VSEFVNILVTGIVDAIEEFFSALTVPTKRYTLEAFFVSLVFLVASVVAYIFDLFTFVDWQEALTCSILLGIIVLIDTSTRSTIKGNLGKIREVASRFSYTGEEEEIIEDNDELVDDNVDKEVVENGTGE
jgi:hypothetical protein